jgi:hypothetical protein
MPKNDTGSDVDLKENHTMTLESKPTEAPPEPPLPFPTLHSGTADSSAMSAKAGIAVGVSLGFVIAGLLSYLIWRLRKRDQARDAELRHSRGEQEGSWRRTWMSLATPLRPHMLPLDHSAGTTELEEESLQEVDGGELGIPQVGNPLEMDASMEPMELPS